MLRGDRREDIFPGDSDRELFLNTLGKVCARTSWQIQPQIPPRNLGWAIDPDDPALRLFLHE